MGASHASIFSKITHAGGPMSNRKRAHNANTAVQSMDVQTQPHQLRRSADNVCQTATAHTMRTRPFKQWMCKLVGWSPPLMTQECSRMLLLDSPVVCLSVYVCCILSLSLSLSLSLALYVFVDISFSIPPSENRTAFDHVNNSLESLSLSFCSVSLSPSVSLR